MPASLANLVADINHLERIQTLATKLVTGICHLRSLQGRRLRTDPITAIKILAGLLDVNPNLTFLPPLGAA